MDIFYFVIILGLMVGLSAGYALRCLEQDREGRVCLKEWINVKERLPDYEYHVGGRESVNILMTDGQMVIEGDYTDGIFHTLGVPNPNITHWMPLPKPPRGDA